MRRICKLQHSLFIKHIVLVLSIFTLAGCASLPQTLVLPVQAESLLKPDYYTVDIPSFDGETIRATLYQPALKPHETAPLIIHAHGFGMFRMSSPNSLYARFIFSGITARKAWEQGYWVLSIDHRGHGGSGGRINMMDPNIEVKDLSWTLDWAERNIPRLTYDKDKPVVGMLGESYGGGLQLLAASLDDRIKAIVPITTWYDFSNVLVPNNVVKTGWLTTLVGMGNLMNPMTMNRDLTSSYFKALVSEVPSHFAPMMSSRSLSTACYCTSQSIPHADAFFIQGFRDVLFPVNEAIENMNCLKASGRDVRLLATQKGHLLPMTQFAMSLPGYDIDNKVTCDGQERRTDEMVLAWFDEKLKGQKHKADIVPKMCLTHDDQSGTTFEAIPYGGREFTFKSAKVGSGFAGLFELPLNLVDWIGSSFTLKHNESGGDITAEYRDNRTGLLRPVFVPLYRVDENTTIAGIPTAQFNISGDNEDIIFASIGVKRNGAVSTEIISDQVYPFRGGQVHTVELPAISTQLRRGDRLGLVFAGYSNQYRLSSHITSRASISGRVRLPIQGLNVD